MTPKLPDFYANLIWPYHTYHKKNDMSNFRAQRLMDHLIGVFDKKYPGKGAIVKKSNRALQRLRKQCEIGLGGNSAMNMANLHVILSVSNNTFYEYWLPEYIHQWGVIDELSIQTNGMISAPKYPGLGLHLDEDWIISHRIAILC